MCGFIEFENKFTQKLASVACNMFIAKSVNFQIEEFSNSWKPQKCCIEICMYISKALCMNY